MTPSVPFEVNFYYVVSFVLAVGMLIWMIFNFDSIRLGDAILYILLVKIMRYARHVRRQFGAY